MNVRKISFFIIFFSLLVFLESSCQQAGDLLSRWQRYVVMKRYGLDPDKTKQLEGWEKEILKYEKVINEKVMAGAKEAKVYRKIGEAYGGMQMYQPCVDNLQRAIDLGYISDDILFMQALCQGTLARQHNWETKYRDKAESSFLKVLNMNPDYHRAKLELGLLYFYGFGSNSKFSVKADKLVPTQFDYREKAVKLVKDYELNLPNKTDGYLVLAGMYNAMGNKGEAIQQLQLVLDLFQKNYPNDFQKREDYQQTVINLRNLQGK